MGSEKKDITSMWDFANLFLAIYASRKHNENDDNIYISKYFKILLEDIMNNIDLTSINNDELYEEDNRFNIDLFMERFKYSPVKNNWRDEFEFDLNKDHIVTKVSKNNIKSEIDKYNKESIMFMDKIVSIYEILESHLEIIDKERINKIVLKYCN